MVNLYLAALWLGVTFVVFQWSVLFPQAQPPAALDMMRWAAPLFAGYNVVRWWAARRLERQRQVQRQEERQRWEEEARQCARQAPDPTFDFSEKVPPPAQQPNGPARPE